MAIDISTDNLTLCDLGKGQVGVRVSTRIPLDVFLAMRSKTPEHIRAYHSRMVNDFLYLSLQYEVAEVQKQRDLLEDTYE